jgi:hypothetical protein
VLKHQIPTSSIIHMSNLFLLNKQRVTKKLLQCDDYKLRWILVSAQTWGWHQLTNNMFHRSKILQFWSFPLLQFRCENSIEKLQNGRVLPLQRSAREAEPQCADRSVQRPGGAPRCAPSASRNHGIRLFLASQYTFKYIIFPSSTTFTAGSHEFGRRLIVIHPELSHIVSSKLLLHARTLTSSASLLIALNFCSQAFHRPAFLIAIPCSLASWNPSSNLISQMNQIVSRQRSVIGKKQMVTCAQFVSNQIIRLETAAISWLVSTARLSNDLRYTVTSPWCLISIVFNLRRYRWAYYSPMPG